jgi:RNA polymerase sigma-70 factor, ECF subfamily
VAWRDELERVYREDGGRMWRAVFIYARDKEVASDAVSEAFAQALRREGGIRSPSSWLWTTAFRLAAGELHRRRQEAARLLGEGSAWTSDLAAAADEAAGIEAGVEVMRALSRLSERQRASVVLYYFAGYPVREVARIIGSTPGAVAVHLHRARERLREQIDDGGDGS